MQKYFIAFGALSAAIAVALGAFGAHGLKSLLTPEMLAIWKTAAQYHLIHSLGLVLIGVLVANPSTSGKGTSLAGYLILVGILIFCGSLYALTLTDIRLLGAITPLGGLAFISGWLMLAVSQWRSARRQ
ncbi:MAG: DUF423 domain-containing protein [bacterium]